MPLPQDPDPVSRLINGAPDALSNDAGRFASAFGKDSTKDQDKTFTSELASFGNKLVKGVPARLDEINTTPEESEDQEEDTEEQNGY